MDKQIGMPTDHQTQQCTGQLKIHYLARETRKWKDLQISLRMDKQTNKETERPILRSKDSLSDVWDPTYLPMDTPTDG